MAIALYDGFAMNNIKFALRQLRKNPAFTAVAVLKLALGLSQTFGQLLRFAESFVAAQAEFNALAP